MSTEDELHDEITELKGKLEAEQRAHQRTHELLFVAQEQLRKAYSEHDQTTP